MPATSPQAAARPAVPVSQRKLIVAGLVVVLVIVAAIVGHAIASSNFIAVGDCVVTNPNRLTGWDIKKVACNSNPGPALVVQMEVSVQSGSKGQCDYGLSTFQDDPASKTYCLTTTRSAGAEVKRQSSVVGDRGGAGVRDHHHSSSSRSRLERAEYPATRQPI